MSKIAKGTLLTLVAGIAWGLSGTSGQYLMVHGFPVLVLTNIRLLIAGVLLVLYMLLTNQKKLFEMLKDREAMMSLVLFALLGLLLNQFAYLKSIYESNAGTATVLQYVCPVGILAYTCLKDWVAPTITEVLSMISYWRYFFDCHSWTARSLICNASRAFLGIICRLHLRFIYFNSNSIDKKVGQYSGDWSGDDISRPCSNTI